MPKPLSLLATKMPFFIFSELVVKLEETDYDSSAWLKIAKDLKHKVEHHLDDEEQKFFQLSGKVLSEKQKLNLAKDYKNYMSSHR